MSAGAGTGHIKAAEALELPLQLTAGLLRSSTMMRYKIPTNFSGISIPGFIPESNQVKVECCFRPAAYLLRCIVFKV